MVNIGELKLMKMKSINNYKSALIIITTLFLFACGNQSSDKKEVVDKVSENANETELLHAFIEKSGDIVNSAFTPALISASALNENLSTSLVLDIRSKSAYTEGHIDGAIQVAAKELINYLDKEVCASSFEKIVIACYSGQTATYYTALLRLLGYGNVYSLKYGMSGWSKNISPNKWQNGTGNKYGNLLDTTDSEKGGKNPLPALNTGKTSGYAILKNRVQTISDEGFKKAIIKVDSVVKNPEGFYIINYWPKEKYKVAHLPGAIQYTPKKSLKKGVELETLPTDKPVVVYCYTGQHSSFVAAYLRVLGYDAHTLAYGANSFMHNKMKNSIIGKAFDANTQIKDFALVAGELPSIKSASTSSTSTSSETKPQAAPKKKKKTAEDEGGC